MAGTNKETGVGLGRIYGIVFSSAVTLTDGASNYLDADGRQEASRSVTCIR
jgi:hypothetical protein